jgi:hypothetical protein
MDRAPRSDRSTVVNRVDLPKSGYFSFITAVEGADGNAAFQTIDGVCETFPVQFHVSLVFSQYSFW